VVRSRSDCRVTAGPRISAGAEWAKFAAASRAEGSTAASSPAGHAAGDPAGHAADVPAGRATAAEAGPASHTAATVSEPNGLVRCLWFGWCRSAVGVEGYANHREGSEKLGPTRGITNGT